jgi:hypothetical protein
MFCPKCRSEYRPEYTECGECKISLVKVLPPEPKPEYIEYEQILATHSPSDRALLKSILDAEGITYYFDGEHTAPYVYHAIPVRLMIKKEQMEKAIEILKDLNLSFTFRGIKSFEDYENEED